jgi:hypothetical protein
VTAFDWDDVVMPVDAALTLWPYNDETAAICCAECGAEVFEYPGSPVLVSFAVGQLCQQIADHMRTVHSG